MSDRKDKDPPTDAPPLHERHGIVERIVKRGIESGIGAISRSEDTLRAVIEGLKLPREAASVMLDQIDETKKGLYAVVGREIRDFLQGTNFVGDMKKMLTGLAFEVKMEVRFKDTDESGHTGLHPDVSATGTVRDAREPRGRKARSPAPVAPPQDPTPEE